ncbi:MAG: hypothetical protein OHK0052_06280 [Anaerolineales bacterium]
MLPTQLFPQETPETRLAYRLQDTTTEDPTLLPDLIQHVAAPLWQIAALLNADPSRWVARTLAYALNNRNTFWGNDQIDSWLIGILLHHWADSQPRKIFYGGQVSLNSPKDSLIPADCPSAPQILAVIQKLPAPQRAALLLLSFAPPEPQSPPPPLFKHLPRALQTLETRLPNLPPTWIQDLRAAQPPIRLTPEETERLEAQTRFLLTQNTPAAAPPVAHKWARELLFTLVFLGILALALSGSSRWFAQQLWYDPPAPTAAPTSAPTQRPPLPLPPVEPLAETRTTAGAVIPANAKLTNWSSGQRILGGSLLPVSSALTVSPAGKYVAVGSVSGLVRVWQTQGRTPLTWEKQHQAQRITALQFSKDETLLFATSQEGSLCAWQSDKGTRLFCTQTNPQAALTSLALSADGQWLAIGSEEGVGLWQIHQSGDLSRLSAAQMLAADALVLTHDERDAYTYGEVRALAFSPIAPLLAVGLSDGTVLLLDTTLRQPVLRLSGTVDSPTALQFSDSGQWLAAGAGIRVSVWRLSAGEVPGAWQAQQIYRLLHAEKNVQSLSFSPDERFLAVSGNEFTVLWSLIDGSQYDAAQPEGGLVTFSPDGTRLFAVGSISIDNSLRTWFKAQVVQRSAFFVPAAAAPLDLPREPWRLPYPDLTNAPVSLTQTYTRTLIQLANLTQNNGVALPNLPPSVALVGGAFSPADGSSVLAYSVTLSNTHPQGSSLPIGTLYFAQMPYPAFRPLWVGESTLVEHGGLVNSEIVWGTWRYSEVVNGWHWDANYPALRLAWRSGQFVYLLAYIQNPEFSLDATPYLGAEALRALASTTTPWGLITPLALGSVPYTVQPGDSCWTVSVRFGVALDALRALNGFDETCMLVLGSEMRVPLPAGAWVEAALQDLNLDGTPERVLVLQPQGTPGFYGIRVQTQAPASGFYEDVWALGVGEVPGSTQFAEVTFRLESGKNVLTLRAVDAQNRPVGNFDFIWDGAKMRPLD